MFGFCRFIKVSNSEALINSISNVWIGKLCLHANMARFDRMKVGNSGDMQAKVNIASVNNGYTNSNSCKASSYAKVVKVSNSNDVKNASDNHQTTSRTEEISNDFPLAILGCYKDFHAISHTRSLCLSEGFLDVQFKYLGGLWVLFEFNSQDAKDKFITHEGIMPRFSSLKPWHDDFVVEERLIWLEIERVPLRAWNNNNFTQVCSK
ncbi:hypothetical protein Tco_1443161 [Tanacetum coccineum]